MTLFVPASRGSEQALAEASPGGIKGSAAQAPTVRNITIFERRDVLAATRAAHAQQVKDRYAEIGRLTTQLSWLKKAAALPYDIRRALIELSAETLSLRSQAALLNITRICPPFRHRHARWRAHIGSQGFCTLQYAFLLAHEIVRYFAA